MKNFEDILKSFSVRDTLNPKVWENPKDPDKAKMKKKVLDALEKIADKFIDYLGEDIVVEDVILTGSLANFNWSEFSDFDLHVVIDFQQYEDEAELYQELYNLKKQIFNEKHNIKIFGYDVELYAQDIDESHFASGTYSVMNDEWIKVPKKMKADVDRSVLISKISQWVEKIDKAIRNKDENGKRLETIKDKLKEYRKSGLEDKGELSYENLVFKFLRRSGHIEKLFSEIDKEVDKELSVERQIQEISTSNKLFGGKQVNLPKDNAHGKKDNWQSSNAWDVKGNVGDPVYAIAPGTVVSYADYGESVKKTGGKKLFGVSFTIDGSEGFPKVYYTHLQNSSVKKGDTVQCGQLLGYIMDFPGSSYDHVHIGVEPGYNIRDLINDDGSIKCSKGSNSTTSGDSDPIKILNSSDFLSELKKLADQDRKYEYSPGMKLPYIKDVEILQTALQFLGFSLPKWGVDGKFGPETEKATFEFQKKFGLPSNGKIDGKNLKYLLAALVSKGFTDSDLSSIVKEKEIDVSVASDKEFYERLLKELNAPVTDENMKFLLAWRQSEGKAGKYNPFNTTHKMPNSTNYNSVGVKNYATIEDGLKATIKTLLNGRYDCIVSGLRNDIGAKKIASCSSLHTWGTGDLVAKVVRGYESGNSPKVSSLA